MNTTEEEHLRQFGADLIRAAESSWQPTCIAQAWRNPVTVSVHDRAALLPAFTMQTWIDLDATHSSLLAGKEPNLGAELDASLDAFGVARSGLAAGDLAILAVAMVRAVQDAFASALHMQPPPDPNADRLHTEEASDGFGDWLPLLAFLVAQCGLSVDDALDLRVDRALMLMAAVRRNQGWLATGSPYAFRELTPEPSQLATERTGDGPL